MVCRQRRKKCDERKPRCAQCTRLRLPCRWADDSRQSPASALTVESTGHDFSQETVDSHLGPALSNLRVADHDGVVREALELPVGMVDVLSRRYTSAEGQKAKTGELRHTLITGIFKGWIHVSQEVRSDDLWSKMILFDNQMQRSGQGLVARLATSLLVMSMHQVRPIRI